MVPISHIDLDLVWFLVRKLASGIEISKGCGFQILTHSAKPLFEFPSVMIVRVGVNHPWVTDRDIDPG